jgi:hypothetical protein
LRVLLDEQLPRRLARHLILHEVRTVQQEGWSGLKNGVLLRTAAASAFDVFLTADQNLQYQQNLTQLALRVIVLVAPSNTLEDLLPLVPVVLETIQQIQPGQIVRVGLSSR